MSREYPLPFEIPYQIVHPIALFYSLVQPRNEQAYLNPGITAVKSYIYEKKIPLRIEETTKQR